MLHEASVAGTLRVGWGNKALACQVWGIKAYFKYRPQSRGQWRLMWFESEVLLQKGDEAFTGRKMLNNDLNSASILASQQSQCLAVRSQGELLAILQCDTGDLRKGQGLVSYIFACRMWKNQVK